MGIWRSHHSIGNIIGSLIAGAFVEDSWGLSFAVPAAIIFGLGLLLFFFLVSDPRAVGCRVPERGNVMSVSSIHKWVTFFSARLTRYNFTPNLLF
jgi:OPA family glycerol-3-phosphate transporter-like MFS transporter 1/2